MRRRGLLHAPFQAESRVLPILTAMERQRIAAGTTADGEAGIAVIDRADKPTWVEVSP